MTMNQGNGPVSVPSNVGSDGFTVSFDPSGALFGPARGRPATVGQVPHGPLYALTSGSHLALTSRPLGSVVPERGSGEGRPFYQRLRREPSRSRRCSPRAAMSFEGTHAHRLPESDELRQGCRT